MQNFESALYLYCFARSDAVGLVQATAVDGHGAVSLLRHGPDLCAVVSEVAQEEFCGPEAELHMQQLPWVAERALRHEAVIEEIMARSPVLPVPFGTLFSSPAALQEFMDRHRRTVASFLARVANHGEWSVKGRFDRKQAQQSLTSRRLAAQQIQLQAMSPGMRHFAEQRILRESEQEIGGWLDQTVRTVAGELTSHAADFCECGLSPSADGNRPDEVLNWAFLLSGPGTDSFRRCVNRMNRDYQAQGLSLQLSGPWPPYRFVPVLGAAPAL